MVLKFGEMGEQEEQQQLLKRTAALAYDYERDTRWADYWSNVLLPSHLSSKPDVERHFKFKFYKRHIDPGLHVEPLSTVSSSTSSRPASSEPQRPSNQRERNGGSRNTTRPATHTNARNVPQRMDRHSIQFLENAWVLVMAVMAVIPFLPRVLSDRSYRFTFLGTIMACGHSLYLQYGRPRGWNRQAIQSWLQSVVAGKDFLYILYSLVFVSTFMPLKFSMVPVICQSLSYVAKYLKQNFYNANLYKKYLEKPCQWLETNSATLRMLSANCEIGLGFLLLFLLITPQRNLIQLLVYWQLLKLMYHAPTTATAHRNTWSRIAMRVNPPIRQYLPFLEGPLGFAQRWFNN